MLFENKLICYTENIVEHMQKKITTIIIFYIYIYSYIYVNRQFLYSRG